MLAGVMLMSAYILEERVFDAARSRSVTRLFVLALLPLDFFCLVLMMVRWQRGLPQPFGLLWMNPFAGPWHPVVGSATVVAVSVAGLVALGWLVWREASTPAVVDGDPAGVEVAGQRGGVEDKPPALAFQS